MWSAALEAILTTLRYLAPATLLTLFWGQQSFLFKLLKHIDSAFRAIVFSSEEQKQSVLQWLAEAGPVRVERLDTVWRHGWVVCGVLDAALPGACAGHPPTRLSLQHAQAIADHYLGVEPVFSRQELESNDSLSKHQEWKLATYLDRIRLSLAKLTPPVSKPGSQRTSPETTQFTLDYVARGSGLAAAQVNNKMHFKVYPTAQQSLDPGEITILVRGPKDTYGMTVLPPILGKAQLIRQKLLGLQTKPNYTENVLPITQGATYLRSYGKNDMNKTYYIPKTKYDIEIEADTRSGHTKISYLVNHEGRYEISITSRGQNIVGSPFSVTASRNIIRILENESFCLEDGEEIDIVDIKTDRKVVLRIVDFVTEKMLLKENGTLEKITADEANILMTTENNEDKDKCVVETKLADKSFINNAVIKEKSVKFRTSVQKVILTKRVCKVFIDLLKEKKRAIMKENKFVRPRSQQDIPDIVNSTFSETNMNPFVLSEVRDKYIIPENISVSLRTEKSHEKQVLKEPTPELISETKTYSENFADQKQDSKLISYEEQEEDDILMVITSSLSGSNPFLVDTYEASFVTEKKLGTFVPSEYETNNSQNEETSDTPIKIIIDENTPSPISPNRNPFIDPDFVELERPKTPVLKIITGEVKNRDDSVYIDRKTEMLTEEMLGNEFINPFFVHQHLQTGLDESLPITDFIIGAPVSLPPLIRASSPAPPMDSLIITTDNENITVVKTYDFNGHKENPKSLNEESKSEFSTPLHVEITPNCKMDNHSASSSTFHSLDSENIEIVNIPNNKLEPFQIEALQCNRNITPKKEIWDSAYVSIDENNSSPDSNNNDNACETFSKQKLSPSDDSFGLKHEEITNMGPAERELWQTCNDLKEDVCKTKSEEVRPNKWEIRRPMFTPIIEESDRSLSSGIKDMRVGTSQSKTGETDPITVAFAELNDMYQDYYPNSETESTATKNEENKLQSLEVDYTIETNNDVDSASATIADVKRQANELEGKISEVQANVTESIPVSQTLQNQNMAVEDKSSDETQFGDLNITNIVLEKKKYWDDRIRQIEAKSQEMTTQQKKRRWSSKQLRHNDSLTKRRGKQIVKNFLSAGDLNQTTPATSPDNKYNEITNEVPSIGYVSLDDTRSDLKLVDKWKKYWDDKLETEKNETETTCFRVKSPKTKIQSFSQQYIKQSAEDIQILEDKSEDYKTKSSSLPVKQELPEEVFKAFETSPKRFFGTSRKQILNKIDTFLGKPSTVDKSSADVSGASHDSGLVSSRISLFHNISHTEEIPWSRTKSKSLHNIYQRKDSDKGSGIVEVMKEVAGNKIETLLAAKVEKIDAGKEEHFAGPASALSLKDKRSRIASNTFNKSFDETISTAKTTGITRQNHYVQKTVKDINKQSQYSQKIKKAAELRRKSFSKSEMDIFNKATTQPTDDGLDKYKSCDELPKINVKNFISLFESVSKTSVGSKSARKISKMSSHSHSNKDSAHLGAVAKPIPQIQPKIAAEYQVEDSSTGSPSLSSRRQWNKSFESISSACTDAKSITDSIDIEIISNQDKETTHLSLSDIELEIVESSPEKSSESSPQRIPEPDQKDYKSRFKMAKEYFQSLEELREEKKPRKLNECEQLLKNKSTSTESTESLENNRPKQRVKKNIKSHSMPSSEISKIWNQLQDQQAEAGASKLVKISEKFNVDDLFNDVMEGRLSRQGSLRGIPHKKAVLEAFRSMENITDSKMSPYEIAVSQLNDFAKENQIKNAQTYLTEYPYLPTTDPSKYHSRLDAKATGLISFKELIDKRPRRNSVPDLRLNPAFTVDL